MNPFKEQMKKDIDFHEMIRRQNEFQNYIELSTGLKFPCIFKKQSGIPKENEK